MISYVKKNPSVIVIVLENVKGMMHTRKKFGDEKPMEIQAAALAKLGFRCVFCSLLSSTEFGLAQRRMRSWSLFVRDPNDRPGAAPLLLY